MAVRNEIKELFLRAACRVFETTREELSPTEKDSLRANLEARIPLYTDRYPILDLVNQFEATADAGHAASVATNATLTHHEGQLQVSPDENSGKSRTPISDQWRQAIQESAAEATQEHFHNASICFEQGEREQATEHLCSGIICSIAAIAALMGWPHRDDDDDLITVVGLATGSLPPEGEGIYELLQSASEQGQDLNSAFAAAMGQPVAVRTGAYDEAGRTPDEAMLFANTTVKLASQLGQNLR